MNCRSTFREIDLECGGHAAALSSIPQSGGIATALQICYCAEAIGVSLSALEVSTILSNSSR